MQTVDAKVGVFSDEVDPITLTPAFEIQHPIAFKDGSGGLRPPIYDMKSLRTWVIGQKATFPHTGLYSDLTQVAAVRWPLRPNAEAEAETVKLLEETQKELQQPKINFIFVFYEPNARVFRQLMGSHLSQPHAIHVRWMNDYWIHHPYTVEDEAANIPVPAIVVSDAYTATYADFRLEMARRLADEDLFGAMALSYWSAHPLDANNDNAQTFSAYASLNPVVVYSPLNDF
jgi:hypothetical protein